MIPKWIKSWNNANRRFQRPNHVSLFSFNDFKFLFDLLFTCRIWSILQTKIELFQRLFSFFFFFTINYFLREKFLVIKVFYFFLIYLIDSLFCFSSTRNFFFVNIYYLNYLRISIKGLRGAFLFNVWLLNIILSRNQLFQCIYMSWTNEMNSSKYFLAWISVAFYHHSDPHSINLK